MYQRYKKSTTWQNIWTTNLSNITNISYAVVLGQSPPTDMRKGRETLADIVRNSMCLDPHEYNNTYITIIFKRIMSLL